MKTVSDAVLLQVKPAISTAFVKSFFIQSKDAIRSVMAELDDDPFPPASNASNDGDRQCIAANDDTGSAHSIRSDRLSCISCLRALLRWPSSQTT